MYSNNTVWLLSKPTSYLPSLSSSLSVVEPVSVITYSSKL